MLRKAVFHRIPQICFSGMWEITNITALCFNLRAYFQISLCKLSVGNRLQFVYILFRKSQFSQHGKYDFSPIPVLYITQCLYHTALNDSFVILHIAQHFINAALYNSSMKQTVCLRHLHQGPDLRTTTGLSKQRYIIRVSTKLFNVVPDPLKRCDHIKIACICRICIFIPERRQIKITQYIQPVI